MSDSSGSTQFVSTQTCGFLNAGRGTDEDPYVISDNDEGGAAFPFCQSESDKRLQEHQERQRVKQHKRTRTNESCGTGGEKTAKRRKASGLSRHCLPAPPPPDQEGETGECVCTAGTGEEVDPRYDGGRTVDGQFHGWGTLHWKNGEKLSGNFQNGQLPSHGVMTGQNGFRYEGGLKDLQFHGKGKVIFGHSGRAVYEGMFECGKYHGKGQHTWEDGCVYSGDWASSKRSGRGWCKFADGSTYEGQWLEDDMHGEGVLELETGKRFHGMFVKGFPTKGALTLGQGCASKAETFDAVVFDGKTPLCGNPIWFWSSDPSTPPTDRLLNLDQHSKEFQVIRDLFSPSGLGRKILKIERVQNPYLRAMHDARREMIHDKYFRLAKTNLKLEQWLFHSPRVVAGDDTSSALPFILEQGFVPTLSGTVNGQVHGVGTYFAAKPELAAQYAHQSSSGLRTTVVARVVVGQWTQGRTGMKAPPPLPGQPGQRYDSLVDRGSGAPWDQPSIFVIQDTVSAYPAYVVSYL
mmetsp:Transcript_63191/g.131430  ORF Transcript_63191/g.131430 Transcript_63191/m.131430 type:complete len:520 (+) Transcript_63191:145-1704(+)